jgi:hypothetical protein
MPHDYRRGSGGARHDPLKSTTRTPGVSQRVDGADRFSHTDWLGSMRYLSDSTENNFPNALRYDAFGNRSATGGTYDPTPFQFAGDWGYQSGFATGDGDPVLIQESDLNSMGTGGGPSACSW